MSATTEAFAAPRAIRVCGVIAAIFCVVLALMWWFHGFDALSSSRRWAQGLAACACGVGLRATWRAKRRGGERWTDRPFVLLCVTLLGGFGIVALIDDASLALFGIALIATLVVDAWRGQNIGRVIATTLGLVLTSMTFGDATLRGAGILASGVLAALLRARTSAAAAPQIGVGASPTAAASPRASWTLVSFGAGCVALLLVLDHATRTLSANVREWGAAAAPTSDEGSDIGRPAFLRGANPNARPRIEPEILPSEPTGIEGGIHRFQVAVTTIEGQPLPVQDAFLMSEFHPPAPWQSWTGRDAQVVDVLATSANGAAYARFSTRPADDDVVLTIDGEPIELRAGSGTQAGLHALVPRIEPAVSLRVESSPNQTFELRRLGCGDLAIAPPGVGTQRFVCRVPHLVARRALVWASSERAALRPLRTRPTSARDLERAPRFADDELLYAAARDALSTPGTDLERVEAITRWLASDAFRYDVQATVGGLAGVSVLARERRGKCAQFATAALVLLRRAGLPSRLAIGYMVRDYDEERRVYDVWARDAHAFVEVHFEGVGWVPFDATPPALDADLDAAAADLNANQDDATPTDEPQHRTALMWLIDEIITPIVLPFVRWLAFVVFGVLAATWFLVRITQRRRASRAQRQDVIRSIDEGLQTEWLDVFRERGIVIRRPQTLQEFARNVGAAIGAGAQRWARFLPWFERSRFGGRRLDEVERAEITAACADLRKE